MKLYSVCDGPPSTACRMTLKHLKIPFELVEVNFNVGEHLTEDYGKLNPQHEIPVLDDNGFVLSEHIAIMQYLCDKYAPGTAAYPKDPTQRALINHRLCYNMAHFYSAVAPYTLAPIFFEYPRNAAGLKRVHAALQVFEEYLKRVGKKYVVSDNVTIADFALISSMICLEGIGFPFDTFSLVKKWYENFKKENPEEWSVAESALKVIQEIEKNPPDLSKLNHPVHPLSDIMTYEDNLSSGITIIDLSSDKEDEDDDVLSDQALKKAALQQSSLDGESKQRNVAVKRGAPAPQTSTLPPTSPTPQQTKVYGKKFDLNLLKDSNFLADFNPENSRREKNKLFNFYNNKHKKNIPKKASTSLYDEEGKLRMTKKDVCDCFEINCPGCHFPCDNCKSQKCGSVCRVNRRWTYETIEYDGKNISKTNPLLSVPNENIKNASQASDNVVKDKSLNEKGKDKVRGRETRTEEQRKSTIERSLEGREQPDYRKARRPEKKPIVEDSSDSELSDTESISDTDNNDDLKASRKQRYKYALEEVLKGLSVREAAEKWDVKRPTLNILRLNPNHCIHSPKVILTKQEEKILNQWILDEAKHGRPRKNKEILRHALYILRLRLGNKAIMPSHSWLKRFKKRQNSENQRTLRKFKDAK
ncbi:CLUMA_CG019465, isoform A [Clunio marinus]|uniref:glutathione transferase n=1 Tax=Clunio marinus TaxID=568069 RepID=A0A1J1J4L3_9DIPT|nr:CLUMA_CG019465, isoform A [Clunio marinus]